MTPDAQPPDPRYPIGKFVRPEPVTPDLLATAIGVLADLPTELRNALSDLSHDQLNTPYREGGWTLRQLTHHIADSHINAFVRFRLALTEDNPVMGAYNEKLWAELHDSLHAPVEWSLELVESIHARWVMLLQSLTAEQFARPFAHPAQGPQTVALATLLYAWHSRHHLSHITHLRAAEGW